MARKVFISFLGTNNYIETIYQFPNGNLSKPVRFIQEALITEQCLSWTKEDKIFIFCTSGAEVSNWNDYGQTQIKEEIENIGLEHRLKDLLKDKFDMVEKVSIPEGFSEQEIWKIFDIVYQKLKINDAIYFDVTHAFRSIPLFSTILFNYAHFLKQTKVFSIQYAAFEKLGPAFEVRKIDLEKRIAPIIDLLPLSSLQDWTFAAGQYLQSGHSELLVNLASSNLRPMFQAARGEDENLNALNNAIKTISKFVDEMIFCRGLDINNGESARKLQQNLNFIEDSVLPQLKPILEQIEKSIKDFHEKDNANSIKAAEWCNSKGYYQQATTILQEMMTTEACINCNYDILDREKRDLANFAFQSIRNNYSISDLKESTPEKESILTKLMQCKYVVYNAQLFCELSDLRNDYNHAGMRDSAMSANAIKNKIDYIIEIINKQRKSTF